MNLASSLAITAIGSDGDIFSSGTQWCFIFKLLPSPTCSKQRINISGVKYTGRKRSATTERIVEAKNATTIHFIVFLRTFNYLILKYYHFYILLRSLSVCLVNHLLRSIHVNLNSTVLLATLSCRVISYRICRTLTVDSLDLCRSNTL